MKSPIYILLIISVGLLLSCFVHYLCIIPLATLLIALTQLKASESFFSSFTGGFLLWFIYSFIVSTSNKHLITERMSDVIGGLNPIVFLILISLIGGLYAGLGGLLGYYLRRIFLKKQIIHR